MIVAYPVPHCSTLVMLSCKRPLSQASSSCLYHQSISVAPGIICDLVFVYLDSPAIGCENEQGWDQGGYQGASAAQVVCDLTKEGLRGEDVSEAKFC